jgi:putative flippase GtrA
VINLWKRLWKIRIFNFMFVGGCGFTLNLAIYYPLTMLIHNKITLLNQVFYLPALLISTPIVIAFNYVLNKKWTYKDFPTKSLSLARYELMGLSTAVFDMIVLFLLVYFGHIFYLIAMVLTAIMMFSIRYFISNRWIWRTEKVKA